MSRSVSLLEQIQRLLERTYRLRTGSLDAGRFVIGDTGYRALYGESEQVQSAAAGAGEGSRTLVRETPEGVRACIYYPDALIERLETHPPQRGLGEANVDAFATLVEELDHLLCIADGAASGRPVSLFELELHANVSKYLVLARFLGGRRGGLSGRERTWLRYHLFEKFSYCDEDDRLRARYRDAVRWAVRFLDRLQSLEPSPMIDTLRRFHAAPAESKLRLIDGLPD